jgi:hypothetical protein
MPTNDQKKNDEIDLLELLLKTILIVKSNLLSILLLFGLGVGLGILYFYTAGKEYQNKMIISSTILTTSHTRVLFENVNRLVGEGNTKTLASQFNVSEDVVKKLNYLSIEGLSKVPGEEFKDSERFTITVGVSDQKIVPELQKGIIFFLENNEFAKVRVEHNRKYFKEMLAGVEREIKDLEKLKSGIADGSFFQTAKGSVMFDPTTVNSKILELTEKKIGFENGLDLSNSVQVIEGFTEFKKESKPRFSVSLMSGVFAGLVLAGIYLTVKTIIKLLAMTEAKQIK